MTYLHIGDLVDYYGTPCRVVRVSDCAAVLAIPQARRTFTTLAGKTVSIQPSPRLARISPNSPLPILNR